MTGRRSADGPPFVAVSTNEAATVFTEKWRLEELAADPRASHDYHLSQGFSSLWRP